MYRILIIAALLSLTACGRGSSDIYRAYNYNPIVDSEGKAVADLASQNRATFQRNSVSSYYYVSPTQETAAATDTATDSSIEDTDDFLPGTELDSVKKKFNDIVDQVEELVDEE